MKRSNYKKEENSIANTLKILGWVFAGVLFISGIVYAEEMDSTTVMFIIWAYGFLELVIFLAFAEIIQILHDVRRKMYTKEKVAKKED